MRSEGFSFNSWRSGDWSRVRVAQATAACSQPFATVCSMFATRSLNLTIGQRSQNVIRLTCSRSQAQYLRSVSLLSCRFLVAGAALCACVLYNFVAGAAFGDVAKILF